MSASGLRVAAAFLQTVVVVDDHAYRDGPLLVVEEATLGNESPDMVGSRGGVDAATSSTDELPPDPEDFATETVVEGFADLGISCAAIAPDINNLAASSKRLLKLAVRSDVVILDWLIRPPVADLTTVGESQQERTSIGLLADLLRADAATDARVRLICIYTGTRDLVPVLDQIGDQVRVDHPDATKDETNLCIDARGTRIVLLAKPRADSIPGHPTVSATELPDRVIEEFQKFAADGMLPRLALASVSAVRRRTHRLLGRFSGDMDRALIAHRSTTSHLDAVAFAVALIGDELASILESEDVADVLDQNDFSTAISRFLDGRDRFLWWKGFEATEKNLLEVDDARKALEDGVDPDNKYMIRGSSKKLSKNASLTSIMVGHDEAEDLTRDVETKVRMQALAIDFAFSALSSLASDRRHAQKNLAKPRLHMGALVKRVSPTVSVTRTDSGEPAQLVASDVAPTADVEATYWMCVQPLCDSVRLDAPTPFPFVQLAIDPTKDGFDLVAYDNGQYVPLRLKGRRFRDVEFFTFNPTASIIDAEWRQESWAFKTSDGIFMAWLGQVRTAKAQTLLSAVVGSASRLGLDEYDYLRRMSTRPN